jgi:hypothetical protein
MENNKAMWCEFNFEVRQIMHQSSNNSPKRRHFCFDANPYPTGRRGLRRNRNVWRAASSDLSHWQLESTLPNKSLQPTPVTPSVPRSRLTRLAAWLSFLR